MLQDYEARQRAAEWQRVSAEHRLLVKDRPEKHVARPRWRNGGIWTRSRTLERPAVQA